ncbi:hypothetical protein K3181_00710 [Qipengyuania sp. YG27]|uniref:Aspartate-semialdehyde dehydrogenase n=1 Tax=Qipengyuania mesophila TaxID=2867246 RepID=A0ABS7JQP2_9SPHN|nr:hypothetical protein [Qipengyuania mesophila]MBX7499960.1 hypothetical protein [Qipengyuania mesophila]
MIRKALLVALPLALAACGQSEPAPETTESAAPAGDPLAGVQVVVDADGLGAKGAEPLRFGAPRDEVDGAIAKALGSSPETSRNEECGAGPMDFSQFGPLQLAYMDGALRGWFLRKGEGVATSDGVRPGVTTLEGLKLERQVRELDTTLPGEFEYTTADYGTITGFAEDGNTVTALQAGVSCFSR